MYEEWRESLPKIPSAQGPKLLTHLQKINTKIHPKSHPPKTCVKPFKPSVVDPLRVHLPLWLPLMAEGNHTVNMDPTPYVERPCGSKTLGLGKSITLMYPFISRLPSPFVDPRPPSVDPQAQTLNHAEFSKQFRVQGLGFRV